MRRHMLKFTTLLLGAALTVTAFAQTGAHDRQSTHPLTLMSIQTHGSIKYLADGNGYPLYTLVASEAYAVTTDAARGANEHMKTLPCNSDCQAMWPPATVASAVPNINDLGVVDTSLIGTIRLKSGAYQLTFNGYPLYYNQHDLDAPNGAGGDLAGQAVEAFGGTWYILHADTGKVWNPYSFTYNH